MRTGPSIRPRFPRRQILIDFALLVRALPSRREGLFHARPTGPRGEAAEQAARSAFLTVAATFSPNAYIEPGFPKGVMPPDFKTTLTAKQIDDLVAYVTATSGK